MTLRDNKKGAGALSTIIIVVVIAAIAAVGYFYFFAGKQISAVVSGPKLTEKFTDKADITDDQMNGYYVTYTKKRFYSGNVLVVCTKKYTDAGIKNEIAPVDAVFAWGDVSKCNGEYDFGWTLTENADGYRVYSYTPGTAGLDDKKIVMNSSCNHLIGSTDEITKTIKSLKKGDIIKIEGYVVDVKAEPQVTGGETKAPLEWKTSVKFTDTGDESSEYIYVTSIEVIKSDEAVDTSAE